MPNLWTTTYQRIYEAFNGARTRDTEFEAKVEEMKVVEKALLSVRGIYNNFQRNTLGLKHLCKEVYNSVPLAYEETSPYYSLAKDISQVHQDMEIAYDNMVF